MKHQAIKRMLAVVCCTVTATAGIPLAGTQAAAAEIAFYVSPTGSDSGDGSADHPFATLAAARDAVRKASANQSSDITVYLHGGDYRMTEPVVFTPEDSGKNGYRIIYTACAGETPVLNGAVKVTGWEKHNDKLYKATLNRDYKLRNLYVNDHRANMGSVRAGSKGGVGTYAVSAGQADWAWDSGKGSDGIAYSPNDIPQIPSNFDDLEIINGTTWNENIVCTRDVKLEGGNLVMYLQQPYGVIAQTPGWGAGFNVNSTHTIYNSYSFVKNAGEFYFDKTDHVLYYYPYDWEDMSTADVEAPIAESLIVIAGESTEKRVENLSFSGLTFENTDFMLTKVGNSYGKTTCQAAQSYIAYADSNWHNRKYEMADTLPAMIDITSADNISLTGNVLKHTGADAVSMSNDVINSEFVGNYVTDVTSSGITIGHPQHIYIGDASWDNHEKFPKGVEGVCKNDLVAQNYFYDISVVHGFGGCAAVTAYFADSVKILHNTIEKTAYNGIHLGWGWCNFKDSETCRDNMICYNRVIGCLNRLHDSGGIYTIGQMPGTIINENYVQGIPAGGPGAPTYGLHNDEGTAWIEENDNILEIDPNVTYTINCEDYGQKHHLTILRTYATVRKMGVNPPDSRIDDPIVVSDNVWPLQQYKYCVASGIDDAYKSIVPANRVPAADYAFPASCQTTGGSKLPIRAAGAGTTIWIAPAGTKTFTAGSDMTKASGTATTIRTPKAEGNYKIFAVDATGKILSESQHILRISGSGDVIEAESFNVQSGIQTENCSEGGSDVAYIENGDYIGFTGIDMTGATSIDFRIGANGGGNTLEVRLDGADGKLIGTLNVGSTGGWQTWETMNCKLDDVSGTHDLYLVFKGGDGYLYNLNWLRINGIEAKDDPELGDVNGDGEVSVADAVELQKYLLAKVTALENWEAGDMNGDGKLTAVDFTLLKAYLMTN